MAFDKYKDGAWTEPETIVGKNESGAWEECESAKRVIDGAWAEVWSASKPIYYVRDGVLENGAKLSDEGSQGVGYIKIKSSGSTSERSTGLYFYTNEDVSGKTLYVEYSEVNWVSSSGYPTMVFNHSANYLTLKNDTANKCYSVVFPTSSYWKGNRGFIQLEGISYSTKYIYVTNIYIK